MATLYIVATPIGNLSDVSQRAAATLASVSVVYAEDTRRTRTLLDHLGVSTAMVSLHEHNERSRVAEVLNRLDSGEDVALVSDAGTPLVSDPGEQLVGAVAEAGHDVVPIPGPSAVLSALVGAGLPTDRFTFLGFVPRKGRDRRDVLDRIRASEDTVVLFESPERLLALLRDLGELLESGRSVVVARELTKVHEEFRRGTPAELLSYYEENKPRGEVSVVVGPGSGEGAARGFDEDIIRAMARVLVERGLKPAAAARELATLTGLKRNAAYDFVRGVGAGNGKAGETLD